MLAALGVWGTMQQPSVLRALDPSYGFRLLATTPGAGFIMLGSLFIALTGAEAFYDDMGLFRYSGANGTKNNFGAVNGVLDF